MAEHQSDDPTRRYEETEHPNNPPNSVLGKDARRAAVWSYFVPVVVLFVVIGLALVYWSNQPERSQAGERDGSEIGTAGRTDGGNQPESRPGNARDEIAYRGNDLSPITRVKDLRDVDARQMSGRRVAIAEAEVESASGNVLWVRDDDRRFKVIAPAGTPTATSGATVAIDGRVADDGNGAPQIVAEHVQVK